MNDRDMFAAYAMQGMLTRGTWSGYGWKADTESSTGAKMAYEIADAMVKEQRNEQ